MARRKPRGITYTPRPTTDPKVSILVDERIENDPVPSEHLRGSFRRLAYLGWQLNRARERRKQAEKAEKGLKARLLESLPEDDIRGFTSRHGRAMKILVAQVMGVRVADPRKFRRYLGRHGRDVVTGVKLDPKIMLDPKRFRQFTLMMEALFGEKATEFYEVLFDSDKLAAKIRAGDLPEVPEGILEYTPSHERVLADRI